MPSKTLKGLDEMDKDILKRIKDILEEKEKETSEEDEESGDDELEDEYDDDLDEECEDDCTDEPTSEKDKTDTSPHSSIPIIPESAKSKTLKRIIEEGVEEKHIISLIWATDSEKHIVADYKKDEKDAKYSIPIKDCIRDLNSKIPSGKIVSDEEDRWFFKLDMDTIKRIYDADSFFIKKSFDESFRIDGTISRDKLSRIVYENEGIYIRYGGFLYPFCDFIDIMNKTIREAHLTYIIFRIMGGNKYTRYPGRIEIK